MTISRHERSELRLKPFAQLDSEGLANALNLPGCAARAKAAKDKNTRIARRCAQMHMIAEQMNNNENMSLSELENERPLHPAALITDARAAGDASQIEFGTRMFGGVFLKHDIDVLHAIRQTTLSERDRMQPSSLLALVVVSVVSSVPVDQLLSYDRRRRLANPRKVISWLMREVYDNSLSEIGEVIGGRNHTSVLRHIRAVNDCLETENSHTGTIARQSLNRLNELNEHKDLFMLGG